MYEIFEDIVRYEGIMNLASVQNSIKECRNAKGCTFVKLTEVKQNA